MNVSIIIVNYNTSELVLDCLQSIRKQTSGISYEVIVVDNNSTCDSQLDTLRSLSDITYIQSDDNLGFGRANNLGLRKAQGEYILFLNSDTLLVNNAIKLMYDYAQNYQGRLGALGTVLEDRQGYAIHSSGRFPRVAANLLKMIVVPVKKLLHTYKADEYDLSGGMAKVDYVTGADLFVSKAVLKECHAFNPSFFMYSEETEMEHRFMKAGYDNVLITGPRIIHLEGESTAKSGKSRFLRDTIRQQRSEFIYFRLTEPLWKYFMYRLLLPVVRQTLWVNPKVCFSDKLRYMRTLTQCITIKPFDDEYIG